MICFFTERHSLLTQVAFMSFTRHCFFRSQVYRGLSGRHCLGTPPRPLVCPTSSAAELPFEGQSVGAADFAASERASKSPFRGGGRGRLVTSAETTMSYCRKKALLSLLLCVAVFCTLFTFRAPPMTPTLRPLPLLRQLLALPPLRALLPMPPLAATARKKLVKSSEKRRRRRPRGCPDGGDRRSALRAPRRAGASVRSRRNRARPLPLQGTRFTKTQAPCLPAF